jgi:hypothetical protein
MNCTHFLLPLVAMRSSQVWSSSFVDAAVKEFIETAKARGYVTYDERHETLVDRVGAPHL